MQFTSTFAAAIFALANLVAADSETFGLLSIHSGAGAHMLVLQDSGNGLILSSSSTSFSATVTDAGKLKFTNGKYAVVGSDGAVTDGSESDASTGFGVSSGRLVYNGSSGFYAIADGDNYKLSTKESGDATGIALSARTTTGGTAADFSASGASSEVASTTKASATASAAAQAISQIDDGQIQATATVSQQTENGAAKAVAGLGAGALAAAALLL